MLRFLRTDSSHPDFQRLVRALDADLAIRDGEDHAFYALFNKTDMIREVVIAYRDEEAVGCGSFKPFAEKTAEVKRMYVPPSFRKQGIASAVLGQLETWARELGYERCVLETGKNQPEALAMYARNGYHIIPNFGQYRGMDNSVCFEKILNGRTGKNLPGN